MRAFEGGKKHATGCTKEVTRFHLGTFPSDTMALIPSMTFQVSLIAIDGLLYVQSKLGRRTTANDEMAG